MLISQILNYFDCKNSEDKGMGLKPCKFDGKTPRTLILPVKGTKIPASTEFDLEYLQGLQQQNKVRVLQGVTDFTDSTPANDRTTRATTGDMSVSLKHPYLYDITFDNGINFYQAVALLSGNDEYDLIRVDDAGNLLGARDKDGSFRGLDMGMVDPGPYKSGNETSFVLTVQVSRQDFDRNAAGINAENLDFYAKRDLDDYNDVILTIDPLSVGGTTISWSGFLVDGTHSLEGTTASNYLLTKTVAGVTTTVAMTVYAYNADTKKNSATIPAAVAGVLFKGKEASVIVA